MSAEAVMEHVACEFLAWVWFESERTGGRMDLGAPLGVVDVWVDERLAFRDSSDDKPRAILTGENPSQTLEARAALAGGKLLRELQLGLRREERDYSVTLKGALLDFCGAKLPPGEAEEESLIYDRMFFYEELKLIVSQLLQRFAETRTADDWEQTTKPAIEEWIAGGS
jgi:hypothetical protein